MTHYLTNNHDYRTPFDVLARDVHDRMRVAGHPCPSGDGYPVAALNLHRKITDSTDLQLRDHAINALAGALIISIDLAEGCQPGGLARTLKPLETCQVYALEDLHAGVTMENLNRALTNCTEAWASVPEGQDGSTELTRHIAHLLSSIVSRLRALGVRPEVVMADVDLTTVLLPGRPA